MPIKDGPIVLALKDCIAGLKEAWRISDFPVVVCGTVSEVGKLGTAAQALFKHEIEFEASRISSCISLILIWLKAPNEDERREILESLLKPYTLAPDITVKRIATQTAALVASDLRDVVFRAESAAYDRVIEATKRDAPSLRHAGIPLTDADFSRALDGARASYSESINAPKIPNVTWDDVGGLAHVKSDILDTIQLPLEHPELFADGLKARSGAGIV